MSDPTRLVTEIEQDAPVVLDSRYRFNDADRRKIDDQILGLQFMAKASILDGTISSWYTIDPSPSGVDIAAGQCVCPVPRTDGLIVITPATPAALADAGACLGVAMASGAKGERLRIATGGIVSHAVTGFGAGAASPVRVGSDTRPERVVSLGANDFPIGIADTVGNIALIRGGVSGTGGSITHGDASQLFITDVTATTAEWGTASKDVTAAVAPGNVINFTVTGLTGSGSSLALFGVANLTWSTGTAAPSAAVVDGSLYTRTGGSNGDLYLRRAGTWVDIGSAATGQFGSQSISTAGPLSAGATTLSSLTLSSPLSIGGGGTGLSVAPSAGLVLSTGTAFSPTSVTAANTRVPFWASNTLSSDAGLTFASSTLSVTNATIATALRLTALAGTDGPLQVVGGLVGIGPGGASSQNSINVATRAALAAFDTVSMLDGSDATVRSPMSEYKLWKTDAQTPNALDIIAAKSGVGVVGNWLLKD